jgi:prophage regulatory protein
MDTNLQANDPDADSYLRFPEVKSRTGLSRTTIHRLIKAGDFPAPKSLGARAVGGQVKAIRNWCASRPDAREQAAA